MRERDHEQIELCGHMAGALLIAGMSVWDPRRDDPGDEEFYVDDEQIDDSVVWYHQMID